MSSFNNIQSFTTPRKILVVTCDLPSHPYAAAKLAKVLAGAGHQVTLAAPQGAAYDRIVSETINCNYHNITCKKVGSVTPTTKHINERPVVNPHSYKTLLQAIWNPFPIANVLVKECLIVKRTCTCRW